MKQYNLFLSLICLAVTALWSHFFVIHAATLADTFSQTQRDDTVAKYQTTYTPLLQTADRDRIRSDHLSYLCDNNIIAKKNNQEFSAAEQDIQEYQTNLKTEYCRGPYKQLLYLDSPYIYDHFLDYFWRSIDAQPDNHYEGAALDAQGKERRTKIQDAGTDVSGGIPRTMINMFQEYRTSDDNLNWSSFRCSQLPTTVVAKRETLSLADKYRAGCMISYCISSDLGGHISLVINDQCFARADARIYQETAYVQALILQQGNQMLTTQRRTYINDYLFGRAETLVEKMTLWHTYVEHMNNSYMEVTQQCRAK